VQFITEEKVPSGNRCTVFTSERGCGISHGLGFLKKIRSRPSIQSKDGKIGDQDERKSNEIIVWLSRDVTWLLNYSKTSAQQLAQWRLKVMKSNINHYVCPQSLLAL
jgi:hypothetical protein